MHKIIIFIDNLISLKTITSHFHTQKSDALSIQHPEYQAQYEHLLNKENNLGAINDSAICNFATTF